VKLAHVPWFVEVMPFALLLVVVLVILWGLWSQNPVDEKPLFEPGDGLIQNERREIADLADMHKEQGK
jgi:hypothetical protein